MAHLSPAGTYMQKWLSSFLFCLSCFAFQKFAALKKQIQPNAPARTEITLKHMPPVRSQDGLGDCGVISASYQLERFYHKHSNDCRPLQLSTLDLTQQIPEDDRCMEEGFRLEGISAHCIMRGLVRQNPKYVIKESCARFDRINSVSFAGHPDAGVPYLIDQFKNRDDCLDCRAKDIRQKLKLNYSVADIKDVLQRASNWEQLLLTLLIPQQCYERENQVIMPDFNAKPQKLIRDKQAFRKVIKEKLQQDIPLAFTFDAMPIEPSGKVSSGQHQVLIKGYKEVCDSNNNCKDYIQLHNVWGQEWQDEFHGGWVDYDAIMRGAFSYSYIVPTPGAKNCFEGVVQEYNENNFAVNKIINDTPFVGRKIEQVPQLSIKELEQAPLGYIYKCGEKSLSDFKIHDECILQINPYYTKPQTPPSTKPTSIEKITPLNDVETGSTQKNRRSKNSKSTKTKSNYHLSLRRW